jgi:hypothetical protein
VVKVIAVLRNTADYYTACVEKTKRKKKFSFVRSLMVKGSTFNDVGSVY